MKHPYTITVYGCYYLFFKRTKFRLNLEFNQKEYLQLNAHGSLNNTVKIAWVLLFKDNKIYSYGIKTSCSDGFRCSYSYRK
ncbi:hypothetical protein HNQ00_001876 [Flavobacterium sp. 14A]|nr:hypothetical protein [Flavobacterium sp. 14A]